MSFLSGHEISTSGSLTCNPAQRVSRPRIELVCGLAQADCSPPKHTHANQPHTRHPGDCAIVIPSKPIVSDCARLSACASSARASLRMAAAAAGGPFHLEALLQLQQGGHVRMAPRWLVEGERGEHTDLQSRNASVASIAAGCAHDGPLRRHSTVRGQAPTAIRASKQGTHLRRDFRRPRQFAEAEAG